jgi:hypothetical protein
MTVQTSEQPTAAAPSCHGHGSAAGDAHEAHGLHDGSHREYRAGATAIGSILALPRPVRIIGGAAIGFGALLAVGIPLATLTPLLFLGGCMSMHLFMGHDMSHGGGHGSHASNGGNAGAGSTDETSPQRDG